MLLALLVQLVGRRRRRHEVLRLAGNVLRFPTLPDGRPDVFVHVVDDSRGHVGNVVETISLADSTDVIM